MSLEEKGREEETRRRGGCENGGRDGSDASVTQGMSKIVGSHWVTERARKDSLPDPSGGTSPANPVLNFSPPEL